MICEENINCENPQVIFDRSSIRVMIANGNYFIDGRKYTILDAFNFAQNFDYSKFNPYKLGLVSMRTIKDGSQRFDIDYKKLNNCYTLSKDGEITCLFCVIPCGHCLLCRHSKANALVARLEMESQTQDYRPLFVTLTYSPAWIPLNGVRKQHIQSFIKRLRNHFQNDNIRYFAVSEYGKNDLYTDSRGRLRRGTSRPHYHLILFGIPYILNSPPSLAKVVNYIEKSWHSDNRKSQSSQFGRVDVKSCNFGAFRYVCKYMVKTNEVPKSCKPNFQLWSRRPGLGAKFINDYNLRSFFLAHPTTDFQYKAYDGKIQKLHLSKYVVNKMFPTFSQSVPLELRRSFDGVNYYLKRLADAGYWHKDIYEFFAAFVKKFRPLGFRLASCPPFKSGAVPYECRSVLLPPSTEFIGPLFYSKETKCILIKEIVTESIEKLREFAYIFQKYKDIDVDGIFNDIRVRNLLYSGLRLRLSSLSSTKSDKLYNLTRMYNQHVAKSQF